MKVEIQIDPSLDEPVAVLRSPSPTEEVEALAARLRGEAVPQPFTVYREREAARVSRSMVLRFYAEDKGVLCQTGKGTFTVRQRRRRWRGPDSSGCPTRRSSTWTG